MKKTTTLLIAAGIALGACQSGNKVVVSDNPFLKKYETPFEVPPFDQIKLEHFLPAIE